MSSRLSLLSNEEIARLRARVAKLAGMGTPAQRQASAGQLEAIDVERERRLSLPAE